MNICVLPRKADLYRMAMEQHVCPDGLKAKDLLRRAGFSVVDHWLRTRAETDTFKAAQGVKTTPQISIGHPIGVPGGLYR